MLRLHAARSVRRRSAPVLRRDPSYGHQHAADASPRFPGRPAASVRLLLESRKRSAGFQGTPIRRAGMSASQAVPRALIAHGSGITESNSREAMAQRCLRDFTQCGIAAILAVAGVNWL